MRTGLGRVRKDITWVNIWQDAEAAAFVASYNDGNETVPTVVTGAGTHLPPLPSAIKDQLQTHR